MAIDASIKKPSPGKGNAPKSVAKNICTSETPVKKPLSRTASYAAHQAFSAACAYWSMLMSDRDSTFEETYAANDIALDAKAVIIGKREKNPQTPDSFSRRFNATPKGQLRSKGIAEDEDADDFGSDAAMGKPVPQTCIAYGRNYAARHPKSTIPQITVCYLCGKQREQLPSGEAVCRPCKLAREQRRREKIRVSSQAASDTEFVTIALMRSTGAAL